MTAQEPGYEEARSALNWPFLAWGGLVPAGAAIVLLAVSFTVGPGSLAGLAGAVLVLAMIGISLLYRNWPTGVRIDGSGISIGAVRSSRARSRKPTVNHQSWGLFSCPWSSVTGVRVVTAPAELRQLSRSPRYYTLTNRWGGKAGMTHCNIGVLSSPFMRAALVIDLYPSGVTGSTIRPARFYSNFGSGRFSRLIPPEMSATWIVPTRRPEALSTALASTVREREDPRPSA